MRLNAIALMTPYRAQKDHIKELANDAGLLGTDGLTVTTITESQGVVPKLIPRLTFLQISCCMQM